MTRLLAVLLLLTGCGSPDPLDEFLSKPRTEYSTTFSLPCVARVYSDYPVSQTDVATNLQLARELLGQYDIVPVDRFCDRFAGMYLVIKKTREVSSTDTTSTWGTFDGKKVALGNDARALLHEMLHYADFLRREPTWMEHNWSEAYVAADESFVGQKQKICFRLDEQVTCRIINFTVK